MSHDATNSTSSAPIVLIAVLIVLLLIGGGAAWWLLSRPQPGPGPQAELGPKTVEEFYVGVSALDIRDDQKALDIFEKLCEEIPKEPSVWINRGLASLRLNLQEEAFEALNQANGLGLDNNELTLLLALYEQQTGQLDAAIARLKQMQNPPPKAMYLLFQSLKWTQRPEDQQESLRLLEQILDLQPDNLAVLVQAAREAAELGNLKELGSLLPKLRKTSAEWPPEARDQALQYLDEASTAAKNENANAAAIALTFLENLIKFGARYQESQRALGLDGGNVVGVPVREFLEYPQPSVVVAAADHTLVFHLDEPTGEPVRLHLAYPMLGDATPVKLSLQGNVLHVGEAGTIEYPGGDDESAAVNPATILPVDLNWDYLSDVVLAGPSGLRIAFQNEDGTFTAYEPAEDLRDIFAASAAGVWAMDYEGDGDLDVLVSKTGGGSQLIRNNGDSTFSALQALSDLPPLRKVIWTDLDEDGDGDLAALSAEGKLLIVWNQRSGMFSEPESVDHPPAILSLLVADANRNGVMDLVLLDNQGAISRVTRVLAKNSWETEELAKWSPQADLQDAFDQYNVHLAMTDFDNNGALDLLASAADSTAVWLANESSEFQLLQSSPELSVQALADIDGNGRLDLVGQSKQSAAVALNRGEQNYGWQKILPRANDTAGKVKNEEGNSTGDRRVNSFGIGGRVDVRAGKLLQAALIDSPVVHFGLGEHQRVGLARFIWPNGLPQAEFELAANEPQRILQRLSGSCPWVFTRTSEGMVFITDFIWRSPLGLRINSQETAGITQTEDWIKIPGDLLPNEEGGYEIRITADLWETHFFDHVSLLAVDHPASSEVYVDERFVPTESPNLEVITTQPVRPVVAAVDSSGRDVADRVKAVDGVYLDTFPLGDYQGLTKEHWVEFQLPDELPDDQEIVVIGTGWIYPTNSSLNVAISQRHATPPHGLILESQDDAGIWHAISDDLGFPAGKHKTVVLPIPSESLRQQHRRFRLRTNLEVYWDALSWSVRETSSSTQQQRLSASLAELRYRGFSELLPINRRCPEIPDYHRLASTGANWQDLEGYYTRFGDVRELLSTTDDRYVIMNAGDEMVIQFSALPEPQTGWIRDFVLIGDGWVKDGDYNTTNSRTVHPLPSHAVTDYKPSQQTLFEDPVYQAHRADWEHFHTRYISSGRFRKALWGANP